MTVEIKITADNAAEAREELARLLGTTALTYEITGPTFGGVTTGGVMPCAVAEDDAEAPVAEPEPVHVVEDALKATAPVVAPKRERGKPSPGKTRRTKEGIAEDEAADAAEASAVAEPVAAISTGEERIDPTNPEDAAQDAADEAAEVAATRKPDLTHDDVRQALGAYVKAFGMPAAMEDGPKLIGFPKVSDIPAEQEPLGAAVQAITAAIEANPFGRVRA